MFVFALLLSFSSVRLSVLAARGFLFPRNCPCSRFTTCTLFIPFLPLTNPFPLVPPSSLPPHLTFPFAVWSAHTAPPATADPRAFYLYQFQRLHDALQHWRRRAGRRRRREQRAVDERTAALFDTVCARRIIYLCRVYRTFSDFSQGICDCLQSKKTILFYSWHMFFSSNFEMTFVLTCSSFFI